MLGEALLEDERTRFVIHFSKHFICELGKLEVSLCHCVLHLVIELSGSLDLGEDSLKSGESLAQVCVSAHLILLKLLDVFLLLYLFKYYVEHLFL